MSSDTISALRFPLMIGIVFIHIGVLNGITVQGIKLSSGLPYWLTCIQNMFSGVIPMIGVPLFFIMSGYLFFLSGLTTISYKNKLSKRVRTLLVPYIIWNTIFLGYSVLKTMPIFSSIFPNIADGNWNISSILATFWDKSIGVFPYPEAEGVRRYIFPQDGPMWYVRELMIMMIASPLFFYLIKKMGWIVVVALGLAWYILNPYNLGHPYQLTTAAFFFSWGACYAIRGIDFVESMRPYRCALWIYIPIAIVDMLTKQWNYNCYIHNAGIIAGIFAAVSLTASLLSRKKIRVNRFLADSSFFLFALHNLFLIDMAKVIVKLVYVSSPLYIMLLYFLVPANYYIYLSRPLLAITKIHPSPLRITHWWAMKKL